MKVTKMIFLVENKIDELLRDERVINVLSKNLNTAIKLQHFANKRLEFILKLADVATLKSLNELFESVNHLEKESMKHKAKIALLEEHLKKSSASETPKKKTSVKAKSLV
jgi:hypothetical protein